MNKFCCPKNKNDANYQNALKSQVVSRLRYDPYWVLSASTQTFVQLQTCTE